MITQEEVFNVMSNLNAYMLARIQGECLKQNEFEFLMVRHTHEGIDQYLNCLSRHFTKHSAIILKGRL